MLCDKLRSVCRHGRLRIFGDPRVDRQGSGYGLVWDFKPRCRFVSKSPAIMSGRHTANVTRAKFLFFPIIHTYLQTTGNDVYYVVHLAAFSPSHGF